MLQWKSQLELARSIWTHPEAVKELSGVLKATHFENPALGWIISTAILLHENGMSPPTEGQMVEALNRLEPHMKAACLSLVDDVKKADCPDVAWAMKTGRAYAAHQEAMIFAGEIPTMARNGQYERIKNRSDELCRLTEVAAKQQNGVVVTRMSDIESETTAWLWKGYFPKGHVCILDGSPGLGKSSVLLDLAARVTRGSSMPFSSVQSEPSDVVVLSAEDAITTTIRPRLEAADADLGRIHILSGVKEKDDERSFEVVRDVERLEYLIAGVQATFVIIDPLVAFLGPSDFHRDQDVRRVLRALAGVAQRRSCCICVVRHLNKNENASLIFRGGGSIGVIGAVRLGMLMAAHPTDPESRVVAVYKSNIGKIPESVKFKLVDDPEYGAARVEWVAVTGYSAAQLLE